MIPARAFLFQAGCPSQPVWVTLAGFRLNPCSAGGTAGKIPQVGCIRREDRRKDSLWISCKSCSARMGPAGWVEMKLTLASFNASCSITASTDGLQLSGERRGILKRNQYRGIRREGFRCVIEGHSLSGEELGQGQESQPNGCQRSGAGSTPTRRSRPKAPCGSVFSCRGVARLEAGPRVSTCSIMAAYCFWFSVFGPGAGEATCDSRRWRKVCRPGSLWWSSGNRSLASRMALPAGRWKGLPWPCQPV